MKVLLCLVLALCVSSPFPGTVGNPLTINVNGKTGEDSPDCKKGKVPCKTINMALKGGTGLYYSVNIVIACGTYPLKPGNETKISYSSGFEITGNCSDGNPVIKCESNQLLPGNGIVFSNSVSIVIKSVTFDSCGQLIYKDQSMIWFKYAVLISASDVTFDNVVVKRSSGTGILVFGESSAKIENSVIKDSKTDWKPANQSAPLNGGGIVFYSVSGRQVLKNTSVIDNDFKSIGGYGCLYDGGGITIAGSIGTHSITIDSCLIVPANNTKGLVISNLKSSTVNIYNTTILSSNSSTAGIYILVDSRWFQSNVNLVDVNMSDSKLYITANLSINSSEVTYLSKGFQVRYGYQNYGALNLICRSTLFLPPTTVYKTIVCSPNITYYKRGKCTNLATESYTGHCPVSYSDCYLGTCYCDGNHDGHLCGTCKANHSVSLNSPYMSCSLCASNDIGVLLKGWAALIGLEFLPITVMIGIIAIFNVNLNQGSLSAFILFSQILTIPFPSVGYLSWIIMKDIYYISESSSMIALLPFTMWNLDFVSVFSRHKTNNELNNILGTMVPFHVPYDFSICISHGTSPLGALFVWYFIAFYPIILIGLFYFCIRQYNEGQKCFLILFRPLHRLLARFWRLFNIQPSFTHTVASVITLCFMQLAAISLKLLHPAWYGKESKDETMVFFYDGTQKYFSTWHIPAVLIAVIVLMFLLMFTVYLLLYPFQWFQRFITFIRIRNDFMILVTDVITGPFKAGLDQQESFDLRYFAGIHFVFRFVIMCFYFIPQKEHDLSIIPIMEASICIVLMSSIVTFRPYKRNVHNYVEGILLLILGILSLLYFFVENSLENHRRLYWFKVIVIPALMSILVLVIPYCLIRFAIKCKDAFRYLSFFTKKKKIVNVVEENVDNHSTDGEEDIRDGADGFLPDRLLHPDRYSRRANRGDTAGNTNESHSLLTGRNTFKSINSTPATYETFNQ